MKGEHGCDFDAVSLFLQGRVCLLLVTRFKGGELEERELLH